MRLVSAGCIGEDVAMGAHRLHAIVLAGGGGRRLGGASKADLDIAGRRLLERVLTGLDGVVDGLRVVVAPPSVRVPRGVLRTLEDPPHGGRWPESARAWTRWAPSRAPRRRLTSGSSSSPSTLQESRGSPVS